MRTLEFHNLLKTNKLLKLSKFRLADFFRFSLFWHILEGFSHTDSHTEKPYSTFQLLAILQTLKRAKIYEYAP